MKANLLSFRFICWRSFALNSPSGCIRPASARTLFRERNRRVREGLEIGQDVSPPLRVFLSRIGHLGARRLRLRVANHYVERLVGPVSAHTFKRIGIGEARNRGDGAPDDPEERRSDLGSGALLEIVAGL